MDQVICPSGYKEGEKTSSSLVIQGRTKPWKIRTPRRGHLQVPQPLVCPSKKDSVEAENCSELTCTGRGSWGTQQSGKDKYFLEPGPRQLQCILIKEEYDFLLFFFLIFSFLLNSGGHYNPQLLYFQSCPCCRLRTDVIYC